MRLLRQMNWGLWEERCVSCVWQVQAQAQMFSWRQWSWLLEQARRLVALARMP
jgi:hypothetical protein